MELQKFLKENKKYFNLTFKQENVKNLMTPINDLIGVSLGVLLLWIGGREVLVYGTLSPDGFVRFIVYLFAMLQPARKLGNVNAQIQSGLASAERVFSITDVKSNIIEKSNPKGIRKFKKELEFKNVDFKYEKSNVYSLENVSLTISKGMVVAIVGGSGSGKTTMIDLIPRFFDVTDGSIMIDGEDIRNFSINDLRNMMGIVSQETILFNDTIANNINYGNLDFNLEKIKSASDAANALEFIENLPEGFNTIVGEKGTRLSGGQKQRISIARAILKNPEILILDEATSALDSESEKKVQSAIDTLIKNRTVIVIAHRLSTITQSNNIIVLDNGKIVESGSHEQLLTLKGKYKSLYNIQFGEDKL